MGLVTERAFYVVRRLLQAVPTILVIVSLNFMLVHLAPGNAADVLAGEAGSATPQYMAFLRHEFGLDKPLYLQYVDYLKNVVTLNFGYSFRDGMPVRELILQRLGPTLLLMGTTIVLSIGVGVLLGLFAGTRPNSFRDNVISVFALVSYATPLFWVGLMLILLFSIHLGWLPTSGMTNISAFYAGWQLVGDVIRHLILPAITLSLFYMALYVRLMRASMLEQSGMDYVVTARSKGLTENAITFRHVLRNACLPVVTMAGVQIGNLLGGSVVVETVFGWPGIGLLAFRALFARDLNLLLGIFFIAACLVIFVNILVDVIYTFLDPRIQLR
ncbi:MAG TPA: ABC transporter permease [Burkholderiales bacterium]|jgi:peptide/nickel transport system permease protein|nr:ABC transporter permease [Burkholderiales bacterium]